MAEAYVTQPQMVVSQPQVMQVEDKVLTIQ